MEHLYTNILPRKAQKKTHFSVCQLERKNISYLPLITVYKKQNIYNGGEKKMSN